MKIEQQQWTKEHGWKTLCTSDAFSDPQLVFVFGGRKELEEPKHFSEIRGWYKDAHIILCSTAGEIMDTIVTENAINVTAVKFDKTTIQVGIVEIQEAAQSEEKGSEAAALISRDGLRHVMVFSDGLHVNGTALVEGLLKALPKNVVVTGGLVGDGADFKKTVLGLDSVPTEGKIIVVGFYGDAIKVGHGSLGGWDPFGPERVITRSEGSVLYELDGKPALSLYKEYLGPEAAGLPGTGLLFPLELKVSGEDGETKVVRTLLAVDNEKESMTFAGDMPQNAHVTLMKANFERLVDGARGAAEMTDLGLQSSKAELAILISCIGRKLVLKERIEEETEAVRSVIGKQAAMTGFYSYGEISPVAATEKQCRLHNQTMTITVFKEA